MKEYKLPLEKISNDLNEKIYKSKEDFFEVLDFFKYWQQSSSGNKYLMNKQLMKEFFTFDKIDDYIANLDVNLDKERKELIDTYKIKERDF